MRKYVLILTIALCLTACDLTGTQPKTTVDTPIETTLKQTETLQTTEPTKTTKVPETTEVTETTDEEISAFFAPESFSTVEEFQKFIQKDSSLRGKEILVPKISLGGFELGVVNYWDDGSIDIIYETNNYKRDNRLSELENNSWSAAYYSEQYYDKNDKAWLKENIERLYELDYKLVEINSKEVYYVKEYSSSGLILQHRFRIFDDDKLTTITLPAPAVEGLSVQEMGKYLEMVKVSS